MLIGRIQERYGHTREQAERAVEEYEGARELVLAGASVFLPRCPRR